MSARVFCQTVVLGSKKARLLSRILKNARSFAALRRQDVENHSHCLDIKKSALAITNISGDGSRQRSNLPGTESDQGSDSEGAEDGNFDKYGLSRSVQEKLKAKGITSLFPVQYETYVPTAQGFDVVVQARTGTGKTLSFGIPLVEKLQANRSSQRGRPPKAIILEPTRELANQVAQDLKDISDYMGIVCLYGGASYLPQVQALQRGVDIVIGTPGRVQDSIDKGDLNLDDIQHVVLDEVDRMLDMGFADSVENIIRNCYNKGEKPQTMLYSATMPPWVLKIGKRYLKDNYRHVNLVGHDAVQTSTTIEHLALKCLPNQIKSLLPDIIQVHCGQHGRAIVFCQTKRECDDLASGVLHKLRAQVLHGDIAQMKRDMVIKAFKRGDHKVLITTDVASRGLDIPNVELVIQTSPPQDEDFYIHRSGRTGRAGKTGVSLLLFSPDDSRWISQIEHQAKLRFKMISAPTALQIIEASAHDVVQSLDKVLPETLEHFREPAQDLIEERGAEDALAAAMAVISGATKIKSRSILSNREDKELKDAHCSYCSLAFNGPNEAIVHCVDVHQTENISFVRSQFLHDGTMKCKRHTFNVKGQNIMGNKSEIVFNSKTGKLQVPTKLKETESPVRKQLKVNTPTKSVHRQLYSESDSDSREMLDDLSELLEDTLIYDRSDDSDGNDPMLEDAYIGQIQNLYHLLRTYQFFPSEGYTTYIFKTSQEMRNTNFAYSVLGRHLKEEEMITELKDLSLLKDRTGVVFDIPSDMEEEFESSWTSSDTSTLEKATELPDIEYHHHRLQGQGQGYGRRGGDMHDRRFGGDRHFGHSKFGRSRDSYFSKQGGGYPRIDRPTYENDNRRSRRDLGDDEDYEIKFDRRQSREPRRKVDYDDDDYWFK